MTTEDRTTSPSPPAGGRSLNRSSILIQHSKRHGSSTWGFFEGLEEGDSTETRDWAARASLGPHQLHPGLRLIYEWLDEQGSDSRGESVGSLEGTAGSELEALGGTASVEKLFRVRDEFTVTMREDGPVFSAIAVHGARLVRYKAKGLLGDFFKTKGQYCIIFVCGSSLRIRWVRYRSVKDFSKTVSRLYMPESMSAWNELRKTETLFGDREGSEFISKRRFLINEFLSQCLEEIPDLEILLDWLENSPRLGVQGGYQRELTPSQSSSVSLSSNFSPAYNGET